MSFLGDLIGSIGGERPPAPPLQPIKPSSRPAGNNPSSQSTVSKSAPSTSSTARPVYKGTAGLGAPQQSGTLKRKAEEISSERPVKLFKSNLQSTSDLEAQKPSKLSPIDPTSSTISKIQSEPSSQSAQNVTRPPAKPPARGSYAALMARAKESQSTKAPSSIGLIKHQATEKDKVKTSKLAERKRQDPDKDKDKDRDKGRGPATGQTSKPGPNGKVDPRRRSASPVKKADVPKLPRAPKPPLHGPPRKEAGPAYKGTMGQAPKKSRDEVRVKSKSRYDEYLSTDEEDESQYGYDDEPDEYYSSDDMEAGLDDMDMEEQNAARIAREEDAAELALENKLKREKEERKRKLAAMAKKHSK